MNKARVLVFDIETAPMEVFVWGRRDQNISLEQIKRDWYILAFSAKWLNDPVSKLVYYDTHGKKWGDDKELLKQVWALLDEADIVITQNGERFDSRKLNARFILNGMAPPSPYKHIDTYKILRKAAEFTSASLEYLTDNICTKYKKLHHKKFPAWKLWKACLENNPKAWKEMKRYNTHDVLSTEELYMKIRAWTPQAAPHIFPTEDGSRKCKVCGSGRVERRGAITIKSGMYEKLHCLRCGVWPKGKKL